jgi:hypothetical protein
MTYARVNFVLPGMHTALIDPVKWNSDWESITTQVQHVSPAQFVESAAVQLAAEPDGMDRLMIQYQGLLGNLCGLQLWITKDAARYFAREDLEKRWMDAGPALRGKHVLIGLSNACSIARNLHDTRMYCGRDLKFSRLQGDGRIVLDWLRAIMVSTRHEEALKLLETPRYIPDAAWDAYADKQRRSAPTDNERLALGNILVLRTKLICRLNFAWRA